MIADNIIPVTGPGQIKVGNVLLIRRSNEFIAPVTVKDVLEAGTCREEIIISKAKNIYFLMSKFIDGTSWIKECVILVDGKMYSIGNNQNCFVTHEVRP